MARWAFLVLLLVGTLSCGSASPTSPDLPATVVTSVLTYACGSWHPNEPPFIRVLMDIGLPNSEFEPDPALISLIEGAGGKIIYRFHGSRVRAELDYPQVDVLYHSHGIYYAITVTNPSLHLVRVGIGFDHVATAADETAVEALGGYGIHLISDLMGASIEDAKIPQVRALPGVLHVFIDGPIDCFAAAGR